MKFRSVQVLLSLFIPVLMVAKPPNILVFIADDAGMDFGCYGNTGIRTPHIDQLAENGIVFEKAFLTTSQCSPSRISLLSGQFAHALEVEDLHTPLPEGEDLLPNHLKAAGYFTGVFLKRHLGAPGNQQFDWEGTRGQRAFNAEAPQRFSAFLDAAGDRPFFLWTAFIDPHRPYGDAPQVHTPEDVILPPYVPDTLETREDYARYYDEIARLDRRVGEMMQVLESRGMVEDTVVVVMSDNGAPMVRDKATVYDSGVRTPFVVSWKGRYPEGERSDALLSMIDLAPTVLDLAGLPIPESMYGRSMVDLFEDPTKPGRERVFAERNWHGTEAHMRMIRGPKYKLILNGFPELQFPITGNYPRMAAWRELLRLKQEDKLTPAQSRIFEFPRPIVEFYDLEKDPYELNNLAYHLEYRHLIAEYIRELRDWQKATGDHLPYERPRLPDLVDRSTGIRLQREMTHAVWPREQ